MGQQHDFSFGSKAWQEYYHGRNKDGHRPTNDKAKRSREAYKHAASKKGIAAFDDLRCEEIKNELMNQAAENEFWGDLAEFDSWPETLKYCQCG